LGAGNSASEACHNSALVNTWLKSLKYIGEIFYSWEQVATGNYIIFNG